MKILVRYEELKKKHKPQPLKKTEQSGSCGVASCRCNRCKCSIKRKTKINSTRRSNVCSRISRMCEVS